ncbi:MAG: S8 family serine peptidase [Candidatus Competibacteraceae bacterium]
MKKFCVLGVSFLWAAATALGIDASLAQEDNMKPSSKIANIVQRHIQAVTASVKAGKPLAAQRMATSQPGVGLSNRLIKTRDDGKLRLMVHAARAVGNQEKQKLESLGAEIIISTADLKMPNLPANAGMIQAWIPYDQVEAVAALDWVVAITPVEENPPDTGGFQSEGVGLHVADLAQAKGVGGNGVTVGVISDGVAHLAAAQATGDLPANVTVLNPGAGDEGTAMLEIIYDMAPGAKLAFHTTGAGVLQHVDAMSRLVTAGANVIVEDIAFDAEPVFQQGLAASTADAIAAGGVAVHSSAGNLGGRHAARVAAVGTGAGPEGFNGPFTDCGAYPPTNVVDIDPGPGTSFDILIGSGDTSITLQWSEPRAIFPTPGAGGFTDLDLYLMDKTGTKCLIPPSVGLQGNGAGDTIEQLEFSGGAGLQVKIVVNLAGGAGAVAPPIIDLRWRGSTAVDAITRAGSLNPDSNYIGLATSSAAVNATNNALEAFSGAGPIQLITTTTCPGGIFPCPGNSIPGPAPVSANAPTWIGANRVSISGAGGFGVGTCPAETQGQCRFTGTSAAAPHAAACEALVRQSYIKLGLTPTVAAVKQRLASKATPRGAVTEWGAGVLNCLAALKSCDLNGDSKVNSTDIGLITAAISNNPVAVGDDRDIDDDGRITMTDARICFAHCDNRWCR